MKLSIIVTCVLIASLSFAADEAKVYTDRDLNKYKGEVTDYNGRSMINDDRIHRRVDDIGNKVKLVNKVEETYSNDKSYNAKCAYLKGYRREIEDSMVDEKNGQVRKSLNKVNSGITEYCGR